MAASAAPGKGPLDERFIEAFRVITREVDRLASIGKDVDAIIYDTDSILGKAWIAFDAEFVKEKRRLDIRR